MPVPGIGDFIALLGIVQGIVAALDGSRGSAAEYQEVKREFEGLKEALKCHQQLLQARYADPALNDIFRSTQSTVDDCQRCIEAFSKQTVKFDRSLGVGGGGNVCKDVMRKVAWHIDKTPEVMRMRAGVNQHVMRFNMLISMANQIIQRITTEEVNSKLETLERKLESNTEAQEDSNTQLREQVEDGNKEVVLAVTGVSEGLRLGWLGSCVTELKHKVSEVFIASRTTLSAVQRIETILLTPADKTLFRTFVLEDALGRKTQHDLVCISSWDNLDAIVEIMFRDLPGYEKVARKEYVFQDPGTSREIKRNTPWSVALLPGQQINMGLLFRKRASRRQRLYCPYCHVELKQSQDGSIPCQNVHCGLSHQRRTELVEIKDGDEKPAFEIFDGSSSESGQSDEEEAASLMTVKPKRSAHISNGKEDISVFKNVIIVEVQMNIMQRKPTVLKTMRATEADARKWRIPPGYSLEHWNPSEEPFMILGFVFDSYSLGKWIFDRTVDVYGPATPFADMSAELWILLIEMQGNVKRAEERLPKIQLAEAKELVEDFIEGGERLFDKLKALLRVCGPPISEARRGIVKKDSITFNEGDLGHIRRRKSSGKSKQYRNQMIAISIEKLGSSCQVRENLAGGSTTDENDGWISWVRQPTAIQKAGIEYVQSMFGRDKQLERTETFMSSIKLWNLRFIANCDDILKRAGH